MSLRDDLIAVMKENGYNRETAIAAVDTLFQRNRFLQSGWRAYEASCKAAAKAGRKPSPAIEKLGQQLKATGTDMLRERIEAAKAHEAATPTVDPMGFMVGKLQGKDVQCATPAQMKAAAIVKRMNRPTDPLGDFLDNVLKDK